MQYLSFDEIHIVMRYGADRICLYYNMKMIICQETGAVFDAVYVITVNISHPLSPAYNRTPPIARGRDCFLFGFVTGSIVMNGGVFEIRVV